MEKKFNTANLMTNEARLSPLPMLVWAGGRKECCVWKDNDLSMVSIAQPTIAHGPQSGLAHFL